MPKPAKRLPFYPAERAMKVVSGRWKVVILYHLSNGPKRLSELTRLLPQATQKVLIQQLREMEQHGLVLREVYPQVPPKVVYSVTQLGKSLEPVLRALCDWGRKHAVILEETDRIADCSVGGPGRTPAQKAPAAGRLSSAVSGGGRS